MGDIVFGYPPSEPQRRFFAARSKHICYGGAKAGGKSWAMRTKAVMLAMTYPNLNILLMRRTLRELRENHIAPLTKLLNDIAQYSKTDGVFVFPNGSRIICGYCDAEQDTGRYQGHQYDVVMLEEATRFTEAQYDDLKLLARGVRADFTPRIYYTCNPGGVGHAWVKRLFIDRQYGRGENPDDYTFIPAQVYDNYVIMQNQPDYVRALESLPDNKKRALLYGDWDVYDGQYFTQWRRDLHVCNPFAIPDHWLKFRSIDYGLDRLVCLWGAADELGHLYVYREYCVSNSIISASAEAILSRSDGTEVCTYAPRDMQSRSRETGVSQAENFARAGLPLAVVSNPRIAGWTNMQEWLKPVSWGDDTTAPRLKIFSTCTELIHCLPLLQHDDKNPDDCATDPHDITHAPDALRYMLDGRPRPADAPQNPKCTIFSAPEYEDQEQDFFNFGR